MRHDKQNTFITKTGARFMTMKEIRLLMDKMTQESAYPDPKERSKAVATYDILLNEADRRKRRDRTKRANRRERMSNAIKQIMEE